MEGHGRARALKDEERAARMRREGVCRTTGRCAVCYRIISIESWKSRYSHVCH
jgi:hypothetical protein